ncbi:MAG: ATP-dependent Clp protease ATP-binding subunit [Oscillospiraceae bacterium]|nr:ATP-dependent Clp protease ATP-binding subunit [Oscillospiraceae bacterium]
MRHTDFDKDCGQFIRNAGLFAKALGHSYVGSEHLLLALCADDRTGTILENCGLSFSRAVEQIERLQGRGAALPLPQGLTPEAKEALSSGAIGPVQVLLALIEKEHTTASLILRTCGVSPQRLQIGAAKQLREQKEQGGSMRLLEQFGINMVEKAGTSGPVIGRNREIDMVIEVLCRKHKNHPALVGDPGVGKTAIVEGLAQRMAARQVPPPILGKQLFLLDTAAVVAGTKYRGEFEERMRELLSEIQRAGNIIVFIDEMHMPVGAGAAEGAIDAANILKPALSRGEIQIIGATTQVEYRKFIEKDAALERRFRKINVVEPSEDETREILHGLKPGLERHHGLTIGEDAIDAAISMSQRFLCDHRLPDKALDLLDEAASHACLTGSRTEQLVEQQELDRELKAAIRQEDFSRALELQGRLRELYLGQDDHNGHIVSAQDVAQALASRTGIPVEELNGAEREKLRTLEQVLKAQVIGQDMAVAAVADAVRRGRTGLAGQHRPAAVILLTGPTGVGKTLLCRTLARAVYGSENAMIRLDMTEYGEKLNASRLVGAPPGYVGYEQGGTLTEKVRNHPHSLVLFDEIDKAHPDVTALLLQLMDEGRLTDSQGRTVDFRNTLILLTANVGAGEQGKQGMGFTPDSEQDRIKCRLRQQFSPEFLGRLDAIAVFSQLDEKALSGIAEMQLEDLKKRSAESGVAFSWSTDAVNFIVCQASRKGGARSVRSFITKDVVSPLAKLLLDTQSPSGFHLSVQHDTLVFSES